MGASLCPQTWGSEGSSTLRLTPATTCVDSAALEAPWGARTRAFTQNTPSHSTDRRLSLDPGDQTPGLFPHCRFLGTRRTAAVLLLVPVQKWGTGSREGDLNRKTALGWWRGPPCPGSCLTCPQRRLAGPREPRVPTPPTPSFSPALHLLAALCGDEQLTEPTCTPSWGGLAGQPFRPLETSGGRCPGYPRGPLLAEAAR